MQIDILTIFPKMFGGPFAESIVKRAKEKGLVEIAIHDLRDWTEDRHKSVDDTPFGGGAGMVMRVDVIDRALSTLRFKARDVIPAQAGIQEDSGSRIKYGMTEKSRVILLDTKGKVYNEQKAKDLATCEHLILIAGHYEGIDHRVHEHLVDEVVSIGEYVLTGGELPAMVVVDSVVRLLPGVLGNVDSLTEESYEQPGEIEYPQYTRPADYQGWKVPEVLLSGNHQEIKKWRDNYDKK